VLQVTCKQCLSSAYVTDGRDVHETLECGCCPEDHHHGQAAGACPKEHDGPCWNPPPGPAAERPDGCTVCRPLLVRAMAAIHPNPGA